MADEIYKNSTVKENLKELSYLYALKYSADDGVTSKVEDLLGLVENILDETDTNNLEFNDTIEHNLWCRVLQKSMRYAANLGLGTDVAKILDSAEDIILD